MELFKTDQRLVARAGPVPGIEPSAVEELFRRRPPLEGMLVLLDDQMRPVEPVSSWFRSLALAERDTATMRAAMRCFA
jgi:hypothetical protein